MRSSAPQESLQVSLGFEFEAFRCITSPLAKPLPAMRCEILTKRHFYELCRCRGLHRRNPLSLAQQVGGKRNSHRFSGSHNWSRYFLSDYLISFVQPGGFCQALALLRHGHCKV